LIEVKHLTKRYGDHLALQDVSFTMQEGRVYGLLGPNGAGKSTTMNIMTGYLAASEGTVTIDGFDILEDPREAKSLIGYLPEQPPLYMDMTPYEYLMYAAGIKGVARKERKEETERVIALTGLQPVAQRVIRNLSKGYRQRVGLAQAIIAHPHVVILDEPTVGLDPQQVIDVRAIIRELGKDHTVILSSHILSEVAEVCDYVYIISQGQLVAADTPQNLSQNLQGANILMIRAQGGEEAAKAALDTLADLGDVDCHAVEGGFVDITIRLAQETDRRAEISMALAACGIPVLSMQQQTMSLEDIFLKLTDTQNAVPVVQEEAAQEESPEEVAQENVTEEGKDD